MRTCAASSSFDRILLSLLSLILLSSTTKSITNGNFFLFANALDLNEAAIQLAAGDARLVRYDAIPATTERQAELCGTVLPAAAEALRKSADLAAIRALVLCLTDNPGNRGAFAALAIHDKILKYLDAAIGKKDSDMIAAIGNLIWISVFGNEVNHKQFTPSVKLFAKVFATGDALRPVAYMWAGAALQNLAASYCQSEEDPDYPGCYWVYHDPIHDTQVSVDVEESGEIFIDGTAVRQAMLDAPGLVDRLVAWACQGPITGAATDENPSAAINAVVASAMKNVSSKPHEDHPNIVPWAAVGALKNLGLLPAAKPVLMAQQPCLCRLSQSADWLEHTKASDLLGFLRPSFPCWFRWEPEGVEPKDVPLCVDHVFRDAAGHTCYDYEYGTTDEECATPDTTLGDALTAKMACCGCNGGDNINMPDWVTTMDDLDEPEEEEGEEEEGEEGEEDEL